MRGFTVLHVEDEPTDQVIVAAAFRKAASNVELRTVADGEEAIAYLSGRSPFGDRTAHPLPQLVLLDLKLPRKSGFEVLEWVRKESDLKEVPIIVLTSSPESSDVDHAYALGATSYLVKSVNLKDMREVVRGIGEYAMLLTRKTAQPGG
jgi:CheY-like chemotaxis protein